jgi:hypothetical protein
VSHSSEYVADLEPGDRFVWADRVVTLERIELVPTYRGSRHPSRWLHVRDGSGKAHRLNYRDSETVRAERPPA